MMHRCRHIWYWGWLLGLVVRLQAAPSPVAPAVQVLPQDGFNLRIVEQYAPDYLIVTVAPPVHNWFAGTFTHLPTDTEVTIGLSMDGNDQGTNRARVAKWQGLRPVMTYADPARYESYEWFVKDDEGRWVSGDPFKQGAEQYAGMGTVPTQHVIPAAVAEQFLSPDGRYWQPWREVDDAEVLPSLNIFRIKQRFTYPTATVAMRVPYTYTYLTAYLDRLRAAHLPHVTVDELGATPGGRTLWVIRVDAPAATPPRDQRPTVLAYAREHATEPDGSWAIQGMLHRLIAASRSDMAEAASCDWLFIPLLDPDEAAEARFGEADIFRAVSPVKPEAVAYATYLVNRLDSGRRLDVAINLHNVECREANHLSSPLVNVTRKASVQAFNAALFAQAQAQGYITDTPQGWATGIMGLRLNGWCFRRFRTYDLAFELNSRVPQRPLDIRQVQALGALIAEQSAAWTATPHFAPWRAEMDAHLRQRAVARTDWWKQRGRTPDRRTVNDLLTKGY